ncbi:MULTISPECIES: DUF6880 family protein [unclassified Marinovum]
MSRKTLNQKNLEALGPERLAALVMELVQGSAPLKTRARMELSAAQGPTEVAADLRKRFATIRRSRSYIGWRKQRTLVKELTGLLATIETAIAPHDADLAFEVTWSFLELASPIHGRTDDSNGTIGTVFRAAMALIESLAPRLVQNTETLAERMLEAIAQAGYGEFDNIIPALAETLGPEGLAHLKTLTQAWEQSPPTEAELADVDYYGRGSKEDRVRRMRELTASVILADVADAQGDVDAYMARYSPEQLTYGTIAPGVAQRLLEAGRTEDAARIIAEARAASPDRDYPELEDAQADCLKQMGDTEALKDHLRDRFARDLHADSLRQLLKLLPDFDDDEAEEAALRLAEDHPDLTDALEFLIDWPAVERAAQAVLARADEIDGDAWYALPRIADALDPHHPLAASVLRRAIIRHALDYGKSKRYRHAARHFAECQASAPFIADYGDFPTHEAYAEALRRDHARKPSFWQKLG